MPVRYDIASQIPQASAEPDIMNMMAQYQAMGYRQQQNMLAQLQMQELQRKLRAEAGLRGLAAGGAFDINDPSLIRRSFVLDPDTGFKMAAAQRQLAAERAREAALRAQEEQSRGTLRIAERKLNEIDIPKGQREVEKLRIETQREQRMGQKAELENVGEAGKAIRELLRPVYMSRDPEVQKERYADIYSQIKQLDPNLARRLGPQYNQQAVEDYIVSPEEFTQARKPIAGMKAGEMVVTPTGRPGEAPIAVEPQYQPNALATSQPGLNALAQSGRMPPNAAEMQQYQPIVDRIQKRAAIASMVPPGPQREQLVGQMDISDTIGDMASGFTDLAQAGGMTQRGASTKENLQAMFRTSSVGSWIGKMSDSEVNAKVASLRSMAQTLLQQYKGATGMTARQMDAVKEMERIEGALASPDRVKGLSEAYGILDALNKRFGSGAPLPRSAPSAPGGGAGEPDELDAILKGKPAR